VEAAAAFPAHFRMMVLYLSVAQLPGEGIGAIAKRGGIVCERLRQGLERPHGGRRSRFGPALDDFPRPPHGSTVPLPAECVHPARDRDPPSAEQRREAPSPAPRVREREEGLFGARAHAVVGEGGMGGALRGRIRRPLPPSVSLAKSRGTRGWSTTRRTPSSRSYPSASRRARERIPLRPTCTERGQTRPLMSRHKCFASALTPQRPRTTTTVTTPASAASTPFRS